MKRLEVENRQLIPTTTPTPSPTHLGRPELRGVMSTRSMFYWSYFQICFDLGKDKDILGLIL